MLHGKILHTVVPVGPRGRFYTIVYFERTGGTRDGTLRSINLTDKMPAVIVMTVMKTVLMITSKKKIMTDIPPNIVRVMPISSVGERELRGTE